MTASALAPPPTAARPLTPPQTTAGGATWAISHCWNPPQPQTLPSSQRQILQECTSDTTICFICFSHHSLQSISVRSGFKE